ncbi:hypothetical protein FRC05_000955 [Tulasnella sp. 425]|nr:hypothetical protein FRC05_000955 [Tulasnella sp. 425]
MHSVNGPHFDLWLVYDEWARAASGPRPNAVTGRSFGTLIPAFRSSTPLAGAPAVAAPAFAAPRANMIAATANSLMSGAVAGVASVLTGAATNRIRCKRSDLLETSSMLIYLCGVPENEELYRADELLVGSYDPFVNTYPKGCRNCVKREDMVLERFIHMTASLIRRGLDAMDAAVVEGYLKENLKWAIRKVSFRGMPLYDPQLNIRLRNTGESGIVKDLKSLEVSVIDTLLLGHEGAEVPVIGGVRKPNEVLWTNREVAFAFQATLETRVGSWSESSDLPLVQWH